MGYTLPPVLGANVCVFGERCKGVWRFFLGGWGVKWQKNGFKSVFCVGVRCLMPGKPPRAWDKRRKKVLRLRSGPIRDDNCRHHATRTIADICIYLYTSMRRGTLRVLPFALFFPLLLFFGISVRNGSSRLTFSPIVLSSSIHQKVFFSLLVSTS